MKFVKINPHPDCERTKCGKWIKIACGLPCAPADPLRPEKWEGHQPMFGVHVDEENFIPAWAAEELQARGHEIVSFNEIRNGQHVVLPDVKLEHIDIAKELAAMPDNHVVMFLEHHGYGDHLMHHNQPDNVVLREAAKATYTPEFLRAKAHEIHRERGAHRLRRAAQNRMGKKSVLEFPQQGVRVRDAG